MNNQAVYKEQLVTEQKQEPLFLRKVVDEYYEERVNKSWKGKHITKGLEPKEGDIKLMCNDYLGIYNHPDIVDAQQKALTSKANNDVLMSAVYLRGDNPQKRFEDAMAEFLGYEGALAFISGWDANVSLLQAICAEDTPVYLDVKTHRSLWEGAWIARAPTHAFPHNNVEYLEKIIKKNGAGVIVIDSLYSIEGDFCPLKEIVEISEKYGCVLVVDEAHTLGTYGPGGAGMVADLGLQDRVHFCTYSLGKGFAGRGGLISGCLRNIEYVRYKARPALFTTAILDNECERFLATLEVIRHSDLQRKRLTKNAEYLRSSLKALGYNIVSTSHIVGLCTGSEENLMILKEAFEERGVFAAPFCAPATSKYQTVMRMGVTAAHTKEQLDRVIEVCAEIRDEVGMWDWHSTRRGGAKRPVEHIEHELPLLEAA